MSLRRRFAHLALGALMALARAAIVGRLFFFGVYRVEKRSMMPTLHGATEGGDVVLVRFDRGETPRRA
jgi:signal peptidase I